MTIKQKYNSYKKWKADKALLCELPNYGLANEDLVFFATHEIIKATNLTFKDALQALKDGEKVALPEWEGYWIKKGNTIIMHCKDGEELDINGQMKDVFFTMDNIVRDDWQIVV